MKSVEGILAGCRIGAGPAPLLPLHLLVSCAPFGVDEVGVRYVKQPGDFPHYVLFLGVLGAVGEGHEPEQLDHALLLLGGERPIHQRGELIGPRLRAETTTALVGEWSEGRTP